MTLEIKLTEEKKKQILDEILPQMIEQKLSQWRGDDITGTDRNMRQSILVWLKDKFNLWGEQEFEELLERECPGSLSQKSVMEQAGFSGYGFNALTINEEMIKFSFLKQYLSSSGGTLLIEEEPSSVASKLKQLFQFVYASSDYISIINAVESGESLSIEDLFECSSFHCPDTVFVKRIGQGKGGTTYKVYSKNLQQYRAIKILHRRQPNSPEASLMAKLSGQDLENIVQIYDAGNSLITVGREKGYAILMEYVDGQTLEEILSERKLTPHEVLDYSAQILNGIKSLRKYGITHRDLKPKNIKVNTQGEVKILDFGIATDESHPEARNNQEFGAPTNMEADDLISFGLLVYKMATGKNLIDVPGKETMGSGTYADEIDRIKQSLYRNGKITEEYDKKIWRISSDDYDPLHDDYTNCTHEEHNIKSLLGDIIRSALWEKDLKILKGKYPTPYTFKIMDAKELRQLLFLSMKDGEELAFDNYVLHCKVKPS